VAVDLMTAKGPVARSGVITRFGYHSIMPYSEKASLFDINTFLIILGIAYVVAFVGTTIALYFYLKNKYKNDEFRRMKNRPFFTKAVLFLLGSMVVLFDIVFIVLRGTAFNNAIVVYNPADAYIIVLSVLSVLIIGYFIKFMVGVVKANKERAKVIKLKLNEDVDDDGTN
jgi:NADH:ubiquinone oxidoreductase subunit 5 (subunit L)/multisubunit Na+/H+ antiporter MnhA subunit